MNHTTEHKSLGILKKFYRKLYYNVLRSEKKLESDSVLLTLIKITSNKTSKLLNDSAIISTAFSQTDLELLLKKRYIRPSNENNKVEQYILTAQGIWCVEKVDKGFTEGTIINFIQNKYFSFSDTSKPLTDTEKVILLSMLGARTFSIDSPMDLNKRNVCDYWLTIFQQSYEFLQSQNWVKKNGLSFEKQGNEHPVVYAMRRANNLPRKTQHIYSFSNKNSKQYFLDLFENGTLSLPKLKILFKLIFENIDDLDCRDRILQFCEYVAYEKSKYVKENFKFIDNKCDTLLKESLTQIYLD